MKAQLLKTFRSVFLSGHEKVYSAKWWVFSICERKKVWEKNHKLSDKSPIGWALFLCFHKKNKKLCESFNKCFTKNWK